MTGISYPATLHRQSVPGPSYTYSLDTMHRATGMTDQSSAVVVSGVQYGAANELLSMSYAGISESRTYNSMFQMTAMTVGGQTVQYTFPAAGQNSGKISLRKDVQSGEEVQYTYDSLNRAFSEVRDYVEMKVRTLLTRRKRRRKRSVGWRRWSNEYLYDVLGLYWDWKIQPLPGVGKGA